MDHVAIMKKSWGLLPKILLGEKTIESRWYQTKHVPWGKIVAGDTVYFKNSGEPITVRATVEKVLSFDNLTPNKVQEILEKFGADDGIDSTKISDFYNLFKNKRYCLLIFLGNVRKINSFEINKSGFGAMAAWITTEEISKIKAS